MSQKSIILIMFDPHLVHTVYVLWGKGLLKIRTCVKVKLNRGTTRSPWEVLRKINPSSTLEKHKRIYGKSDNNRCY